MSCSDYSTDTKTVMDNVPRVLQAMIDVCVCAESDWLASTLRRITMLKMMVQARWDTDSFLLTSVLEEGEMYEAKILRLEMEEQ